MKQLIALAFSLLTTLCALATPGQLDTAFGTGGYVRSPIPINPNAQATAVAVQPDGRIVMVGGRTYTSEKAVFVTRVNADGTPDTTFNGTGTVITEAGSDSMANAVAIQPDGRIIVAGRARQGTYGEFLLVRYNTNGSLDTTFGATGIVTTVMGVFSAEIMGLALQPDGKIVVAGDASNGSGSLFALARYNTNGTLDTTFSGDGKVMTPVGGSSDKATAVAIQADGRIVAVGSVDMASRDFGAVRYEANGALDTTFNGTGTFINDINGSLDTPYAVAIQSNGRIVIAGAARNPTNFDYNIGVVRLTTSGAMDSTFSGNGKLATALPNLGLTGRGVALDSEGRIVVAGLAESANIDKRAFLARYLSNGNLDESFGAGGLILFEPGQDKEGAGAGFAPYGNGSYVVTLDFDHHPALARRLGNGSPDLSFGADGAVAVDIPATAVNSWIGIGTLPDGRIVAGGESSTEGGPAFSIVRYTADGSIDTTLAGLGYASATVGVTGFFESSALAMRADGEVVLVGSDFSVPNYRMAAAKFRSTGKLETLFSGDGKVLTDNASTSPVTYAVASHPDGRTLLAGSAFGGTFNSFALTSFSPDGDPTNTRLYPVVTADSTAHAVAVQPDGKILLAGVAISGGDRVFALARLTEGLVLDTTFSTDGIVLTAFSASDHEVNAMAVQDDGKIVVVGRVSNPANQFIDSYFAIARYTTTGALDITFNGSGKAVIDFGPEQDAATAVAIQPDGKIVVVGYTSASSAQQMVVARYNTNGSLDTTFGSGGTVIAPLADVYAKAVAIAPDGGILVAGSMDGRGVVVRLLGNTTPNAVSFTAQLNATPGTIRTSNAVTVIGLTGPYAISVAGGAYSIGCTSSFTTLPGTIASGSTVCVRHQASNYPGALTTTTLYLGSRSATFTSTTAKVASATTLTSSLNPAAIQSTVTFTATVTGAFDTPSGLVTFRDGALVIGSASVNASGVATISLGSLLLGSHTITATYGGDGSYNTSASSALTQVISGNALTVSAATSNASVPYGTTLTFTATLSVAPPGSAIVFFYANDNFIGADTTNGTTATFATRSLPAGTYQIAAEFIGGGSYGPAVSSKINQTVVPAASSTVLASNASPGNLGSPVTLTAVVASAGEAIGGTVAFTKSGVALAGCSAVKVAANGSAGCAVSNLPAGNTSLLAQYSGDGNNLASSSNAFVQVVVFDAAADTDNDGIPNGVELTELRDPLVKDNDLFNSARWFAMQQYRDFLGREGDAGGINAWVNYMNGGGTRAAVTEGFFGSGEFQGTGSPVVRLYFAYFLRIPDYSGLTFWMNYYRTGHPLVEISNAFAGSQEFVDRYGALTNSAFVDLVYQNVLGRAPDAGGKAFWLGQLNGGTTRGEMMIGFSESAEYQSTIFSETYVTMMYVGMLKREPDAGGFTFWTGYLDQGNSGQALINGFLVAPEYRNRFLP